MSPPLNALTHSSRGRRTYTTTTTTTTTTTNTTTTTTTSTSFTVLVADRYPIDARDRRAAGPSRAWTVLEFGLHTDAVPRERSPAAATCTQPAFYMGIA